jgi:hypothetical protein
MKAVGEDRAAREPTYIQCVESVNAPGHEQCTAGDRELEQTVGEHRASDAVGDPRRRGGAERETAHVRGEHRGDREVRRAEDEAQLAAPRGLVEQSGEARQEEAGQEQREAQVHSV